MSMAVLQSTRPPVGWRALRFTDHPHRSTASPKEGRRTPGSPTKLVWAARDDDASVAAARLGSGFGSRLRIGVSDFGRLGPDVLPGRSSLVVKGQIPTCGGAASDDDYDALISPSIDRSEQEKNLVEANEFLRIFYEFWGPILADPPNRRIIDPIPDGSYPVTEKDLEYDETLWDLYERWCKAFNKERDHAEMVRRFPIFKVSAKTVNNFNTYVPEEEEDTFLKEEWEVEDTVELGPFADGGDPPYTEYFPYLNEDQSVLQTD